MNTALTRSASYNPVLVFRTMTSAAKPSNVRKYVRRRVRKQIEVKSDCILCLRHDFSFDDQH